MPIVSIVLSFLVVVAWLVYLALHFIFKNFRIAPGTLIAWQIVGLWIFFSSIMYEYLIIVEYSALNEFECRISLAI